MKCLAATLLLLAACHTNAPVATDADAARAAARWPGTTTEELNRGRSLFMGHCGTCHQPPRPTKYSADEWPGHVAEMRERAGLTFDEQQLVEHYVVTMASAQ
jgi:hypothetical protein